MQSRECLWCSEVFMPTRIDKKVCSRKCGNSWSSWQRTQKLKMSGKITTRIKVEDKDGLRKCTRCKEWKNKIDNFRRTGDVYFTFCKACQDEGKREKINGGSNELFNEVGRFVLEIKNQNYWVDYVDIFRLVDLYDKLWPNLQSLPYAGGDKRYDPEKSAIAMFDKVARWWVLQKKMKQK